MFEPTADSRIAANTVWDIYQSYLLVGFTEEQATLFIQGVLHGIMIGNSINPPTP